MKTNEICASMVTEQKRAFDELGVSYAGTAEQLADGIDGVRDVFATRLERIQDLGRTKKPPHAYTRTLSRYVARLEKATDTAKEALTPDPMPVQQLIAAERPRLVREAQSYGIDQCRQLDARRLPLLEQPLDESAGTG